MYFSNPFLFKWADDVKVPAGKKPVACVRCLLGIFHLQDEAAFAVEYSNVR